MLPALGVDRDANLEQLEAALTAGFFVPIEPGHAITVDVGPGLSVYELRSSRSPIGTERIVSLESAKAVDSKAGAKSPV